MKDPQKSDLDKAIELRLEGYGMKVVQAQSGLSHSQAELACMAWEYFVDAGAEAITLDPATVKVLRDDLGISWGAISVMGGLKADLPLPKVPESKVRKMYTEATGNEHKGIRNGHGGRWLQGDQTLYEDNLKATGTVLAKGEARQIDIRQAKAQLQKYMQMSWTGLVEAAEAEGIEVPKGAGKHAKLAAKLARQEA